MSDNFASMTEVQNFEKLLTQLKDYPTEEQVEMISHLYDDELPDNCKELIDEHLTVEDN